MRAAVVVLLFAAVGWPLVVDPDPVPEVWDETLHEARRQGFSYRDAWRWAAKGDREALRSLLEFTRHTDAASALGHGIAIYDLGVVIGDARLAESISEFPLDRRRLMRDVLWCGVAYGHPSQKPELTPALFPLTWAASSSPSP